MAQQVECAAAPVPWSDGFETTTSSNATTLVRAKNVRRRFLRIYDDAIPNELCAALTEDAVTRGRPWGCYVPLADLDKEEPVSPEVDDATRQQWARRVVRSVLERSKEDISLDAAHGVAVWCLASPERGAVATSARLFERSRVALCPSRPRAIGSTPTFRAKGRRSCT